MNLIKELIHRRIPRIIGSYLIAGTSLILFIDWLINRYSFPEYYTTLCLFGVIAIMPSVFILAYFLIKYFSRNNDNTSIRIFDDHKINK